MAIWLQAGRPCGRLGIASDCCASAASRGTGQGGCALQALPMLGAVPSSLLPHLRLLCLVIRQTDWQTSEVQLTGPSSSTLVRHELVGCRGHWPSGCSAGHVLQRACTRLRLHAAVLCAECDSHLLLSMSAVSTLTLRFELPHCIQGRCRAKFSQAAAPAQVQGELSACVQVTEQQGEVSSAGRTIGQDVVCSQQSRWQGP